MVGFLASMVLGGWTTIFYYLGWGILAPEPGCGPDIAFTGGVGADTVSYNVSAVEGGPWRTEEVRYHFERVGDDATDPPPPPDDTLANASERGPGAKVRYVDRAGPAVVTVGDTLLLDGTVWYSLVLFDLDGRMVGGTWACA